VANRVLRARSDSDLGGWFTQLGCVGVKVPCVLKEIELGFANRLHGEVGIGLVPKSTQSDGTKCAKQDVPPGRMSFSDASNSNGWEGSIRDDHPSPGSKPSPTRSPSSLSTHSPLPSAVAGSPKTRKTHLDAVLVLVPDLAALPVILLRLLLGVRSAVGVGDRDCGLEVAFKPGIEAGVVGGLEGRAFF